MTHSAGCTRGGGASHKTAIAHANANDTRHVDRKIRRAKPDGIHTVQSGNRQCAQHET